MWFSSKAVPSAAVRTPRGHLAAKTCRSSVSWCSLNVEATVALQKTAFGSSVLFFSVEWAWRMWSYFSSIWHAQECPQQQLSLLVWRTATPQVSATGSCTGQKPAARSSIRVYHPDGREPSTWPIIGCLPDRSMEELGLQPDTPVWDVGVPNDDSTCCSAVPVPGTLLFFQTPPIHSTLLPERAITFQGISSVGHFCTHWPLICNTFFSIDLCHPVMAPLLLPICACIFSWLLNREQRCGPLAGCVAT